jgi:hypothetical protein
MSGILANEAHPSGRFVYTTRFSNIAVFAVDPTTGALTLKSAAGGKTDSLAILLGAFCTPALAIPTWHTGSRASPSIRRREP